MAKGEVSKGCSCEPLAGRLGIGAIASYRMVGYGLCSSFPGAGSVACSEGLPY